MAFKQTIRTSRLLAPLLAVTSIAAAYLAFSVMGASAATPTNMSWTVSNNQIGVAGVTYSYSVTPATTGIIKTITFAVSGSGLAGTPTISRNFGIGAGTVSRTGQTI